MNVLNSIKKIFSTSGKTAEFSIPHTVEQIQSSGMATPSFKGEVIRKQIKFPTELGEEHPFDFELVEDLSKDDGVFSGTVNKYLDFILGPGIWVSSTNKTAEDIITTWIQDVNFNFHLRKWIKEGLVKGTGFLELASNDKGTINGVKIRNAKYMYIKRDEYGNIEAYNQFIGNTNNYSAKKVTSFSTNEMAHIAFDPVGDEEYGQGIVHPLLLTYNRLLSTEDSLNTLMKRKANAPLHWKVGVINTTEPKNSLIPDESVLSAIENKLTHIEDKTEWVTGPEHSASVVDFGNFLEKFEPVLKYYNTKYIYGSQIPEVLFGTGSIPEGLAKEQRKGFDRRIQALQLDAEKTIESVIFRKILQSQGIDDHVELHWGEKDVDDVNEKIASIKELLKVPGLEPALAFRLQKELVKLYEFETEVLPDKMPDRKAQDEVDQANREEEEEQVQPIVPGSNRIKNSVEEDDEKLPFNENKDFMLKEWLGFNFLTYKEAIALAIKDDNFEQLKAKTQEGLEAGLLNEVQVEELRTILDEGFAENMSINEISKNIDKRVAPGDRYRLDANGQIERNKSGERILSVSSKNRGKLIARSEVTRLANEGARRTYEDAGVAEYKWVAAFSDRTCPICEELNGQVFDIKNRNSLQPPAHTACRCTIVPIVQLSASIKIRELAFTHIINEYFNKEFNDPFIKEFHEHGEV